jgi:pilus assembly protein TadC
MPWIGFALFTCLPALMVRSARRKRVNRIEQDLPITLELLATLGEAGIGFDAALERILAAQEAGRPLAEEFRLFQMEVLAGRPRVASLRGLARRIDVSSFTIFMSAMVQASQVGAGVADVLRRQVEDLRSRRRERALTMAAAMPVKLLFPLIICFLPGIFVAALGPAFYQVFQMIDGFNRSRGRA